MLSRRSKRRTTPIKSPHMITTPMAVILPRLPPVTFQELFWPGITPRTTPHQLRLRWFTLLWVYPFDLRRSRINSPNFLHVLISRECGILQCIPDRIHPRLMILRSEEIDLGSHHCQRDGFVAAEDERRYWVLLVGTEILKSFLVGIDVIDLCIEPCWELVCVQESRWESRVVSQGTMAFFTQ